MMMADGFQEVTDLGEKMFVESGGKITKFSRGGDCSAERVA